MRTNRVAVLVVAAALVVAACFAAGVATANDGGEADATTDASTDSNDDAAEDAQALSDACTPPLSCYCTRTPCGFDDSAVPSSGCNCDVDNSHTSFAGWLLALVVIVGFRFWSRSRRA